MIVLGIETSCDETAVALVADDKRIISQRILSQVSIHQPYGGVVPEIASRSHIEHLQNLIEEVFKEAKVDKSDIDAIAVTAGPGLIGGVLVGVMVAKGLSASLNKPIVAVNHLEGHALSVRLAHDINFPFLLLLISGGHCQILQVNGVGDYALYGETLDDAIGEAYDKVARMLSLGYPGGPIIEKRAKLGNSKEFDLPRPLIANKDNCNFSLSGLKTAVNRLIKSLNNISEQNISDIAASFQQAILDIIIDRLSIAIKKCQSERHDINSIVLAGGVASNLFIREGIKQLAEENRFNLIIPPVSLCTDNAAMIAWAGIEKYKAMGADSIDFEPRSRWPLF